jgi:phosphatidylglycerophosphate synthase
LPYAGLEEDRFDRFFNRPLARPLARVFARLGWHPNTVSIIGLLLGVIAGWFWQYQTTELALIGVALLIASTVLDNTDGMVARLTGKTSEFGKVLDGVCDNFVFASIYAFSLLAMWHMPAIWGGVYGPLAIPVLAIGAVSHSHQSAMTDFYKMEWKYWLLGSDGAKYRTCEELQRDAKLKTGLHRVFLGLLANHAGQQARLARVRLQQSTSWATRRGQTTFSERYAKLNNLPMQGWFVMGPNWHLFSAMVFLLLGRMDLYFIAQFTIFNVVMVLTQRAQNRADKTLTEFVVS